MWAVQRLCPAPDVPAQKQHSRENIWARVTAGISLLRTAERFLAVKIPSFACCIVFLLLKSEAAAQRNQLRPADFEPLTELPWEAGSASREAVLDRIFREPNGAIRYPVLAEYLRIIPTKELVTAFDECIAREGTQTPDDLVEFFLEIWASRDPVACWERTKKLFRVVGIEEGWLGYDSWGKRVPIEVVDLKALRASPFWLQRRSLLSFPLGVDASEAPEEVRLRILKEFADLWFSTFKTWPGYQRPHGLWWHQSFRGYTGERREMMDAFRRSAQDARPFLRQAYHYDPRAVEVALRRVISAGIASPEEVLQMAAAVEWGHQNLRANPPVVPSEELLMIWAKLNLPGLVKWADSVDEPVQLRARGFLMSRVEPAIRDRWLAAVRAAEPDENWDAAGWLLERWAQWDPAPAAEAALARSDSNTIIDVFIAASDGPWPIRNAQHGNLDFIKNFDPARLPERAYEDKFMNWEMIVETWGDINIGEAARYGFDFLVRTGYAPREDLIQFFSGIDGFTDDAMVDRTFCCLRVWAVVRPKEMAEWITSLKDVEMQNALWWLLANPWGWGEKE